MKYLGIDFGLRRIGLATSDGQLATPWKIVEVAGFGDAVEKTVQLTRHENFQKIIVGLPEGRMGKTVLAFIKALQKSGLEVIEADETLSSQKALQQMIEQNIPQKKRKAADAVAAAIILQQFLDRE